MVEVIKPNFDKIMDTLKEQDKETQDEIKQLFTEEIPDIETCGEKLFEAEEYEMIVDEFENMSPE